MQQIPRLWLGSNDFIDTQIRRTAADCYWQN
jgi:hypothetical protein